MPTLAKLTRPKTHHALQRDRLFTLLDGARDHPLIWVTSPPGAGKTTLVSSYLERRKLRSVWYQVDPGDEDIATFFFYLTQAVPGGKRDQALPQFLSAHRTDLTGFCRHFFRALFARSAAPVVLALDNYHELAPGAPLHTVLESISAEVPEGCSLVVISRTQPPVALASLQLNGRMAVLDWTLLKLSLEETRALAAVRAPLDESTLRRLHGAADGWAAGIALAMRRQQVTDTAGTLERGHDVASMFEQFASQLMVQATPELQEFLIRTALLPTLTAQSANKLSGRNDAAVLLEDLHRRGLFTNRRNTRPLVYQYHDLFRSYLLTRLEATLPASEVTQLRRDAGALLEETGHRDHAIRLYLAVQDWESAKRALMSGAGELLGQGRSESLRDWVRALPPEHAAQPWMRYWLGAALARLAPPLARAPLAEAWHSLAPGENIVLRRLICADMVLTFAFEYSDFAPLDEWGKLLLGLLALNEPFSLAQVEMHVHTACLFALSQRLPQPAAMQRCLSRTLALIDHESIPPDLAAVAAGFVLVQHFSLGTLREAHGIAQRLAAMLQQPGLSPMVVAMSCIQLGHLAVRRGEGQQAREALERGLAVARENVLHLPMLQVYSHLGLAFEALQRGDLAQAEVHRQAIEQATEPERKTDRVAVLRIHFWIACHRGQWELAQVLAEKQLALANECGLFVVIFENYILLAYTFAQTLREAQMESTLRELGTLLAGTAFAHFGYQCDMARAWYALRAGDLQRAHRALSSGLAGSRSDEGRFMLRMQPGVLPGLLGEALRAGIDTGYALQLITEMRLPAPTPAVEGWPWPIRIYTLGRFEVQRQGKPLEFSRKAPKKTLALLKVIIALGGRGVREQRLLDTFWPDEEGDVAMRSLTAALHRLRALLDVEDALIQQGGVLSLNTACVWVDSLAFDAQLADVGHANAQVLLGLYRGAFLREDEGEPWSVTTRERLKSRFIHALGVETARLEKEGRYDLAIECYLRGIDADPVIEFFYQGLMRCHAHAGRPSEGLAIYRRLKHILSVTLSVKPSAATERLHQSLRLDSPDGFSNK